LQEEELGMEYPIEVEDEMFSTRQAKQRYAGTDGKLHLA